MRLKYAFKISKNAYTVYMYVYYIYKNALETLLWK